MTNDQAKFLLHAYRPGGADAADPALAEALQRARSDPKLAAWFAREQLFAATMAEKLRALTPPPGLRESLLAGHYATAVTQRRHATGRRIWLPMAAALALCIGAALWWRFAPIPGATLDEFAANYVARGFLLQERSADVTELKSWLVAQGGPRPGELPAQFADLRALGCRTLEYQGAEISLLCFERNGKEYHVLVARRDQLRARTAPRGDRLAERNRHVVAWWTDAGNYYVLVSDAARNAVGQLLSQAERVGAPVPIR
jgi:hypothetical protein